MTEMLDVLEQRVKPQLMARMALIVIALFAVIFFVWAALAKVDEVSRGVGKVIPSRQLQIVQNLEGGIVKEVLVKQGDRVTAGQVLLRLDQTQFEAQFLQGQEGYNALVAKITRLQGEVDGVAPRFPAKFMQNAGGLVQSELALYSARQAELLANLNVAQAKLAQAQRLVAESDINATTARQNQSVAEQEVAMLRPLVEKGIEPQIEMLRAQGRAMQATGETNAAQVASQRARSQVAEAQAEIRSVTQQFRSKAFTDLAAAKAELAGSGRQLPALEDRVTRTDVRAPIAGTVSRVLINTIGGVVRPGEPLVEIVPRDDTLVVEARISPKDIAFITTGQRATVKLTAYNSAIYGSLKGRIEYISPDAIPDEKSPETHYIIRVRTDTDRLETEAGQKLPISPGMVANVDVLGRPRSILSYLLTPINRVSESAMRENTN